MKNIAALLILIIIICSCKYKIVSPFDRVSDSINDNNSNKNLYIIDANATEEEIKDALQKNIESTGKNIIIVEGYIGANSKIFDNIKNALKNKTNIELDLSKAVMESNYIYTLENALFVTTVYFASSQKIIANFFKGCTSLVNVQLPSLLLIIDNSSFENCNSLKNIEYLGTSPNAITGTPFAGTVKPSDLYLPNVTKDPGDGRWKNFLGADWVNIHYGTPMPK
uniref:leucine-rich repeat protein n=1 Tax=Brachyspira catarrhinii TaxID=2528966 RepID=UPI003F4B878F